jgi:pyrroline-5-carboxylate reductase
MSRLALLGGGKMGEALLAGLLAPGWRRPDEKVVQRSQELAGGEPEA